MSCLNGEWRSMDCRRCISRRWVAWRWKVWRRAEAEMIGEEEV